MNSVAANAQLIPESQWGELVDYLREELQEYGEFLVLLDEQQRAILKQDADSLRYLEEQIQQQIDATSTVRTKREDMVATLAILVGYPEGTSLKEMLTHFPLDVQPMMEALIEEINTLIGKTRKALKQNHMLLARATEVAEKILTALNPRPSTKTYGKTGAISFKTNNVGSCIRTSA